MQKDNQQNKQKPKVVTVSEFAKMIGNDLIQSRDTIIEFGNNYQKALENSVATEKRLKEALAKIADLEKQLAEKKKPGSPKAVKTSKKNKKK